MSDAPDHGRDSSEPPFGFWRRSYAMVVKEFIQLRRDRVSFAMIVMIPVMQLLLFGYAINTTPRHLPTAVLLQEDSDLARPILKALENTAYFRFTRGGGLGFNMVPGLVGTILTMTMLIFTALSVTREIERGTMENLLAMPIKPVEVMFGKIIPYVLVGFIQATLIISIGVLLFGVPVLGSMLILALLTTLFITTNLSIGYTFSTIVQNQLQAMQLSMMFFLPSILLSGFMFPFAGMPVWAQYIGEGLPLTHYLRIVRAIMLKCATFQNLQNHTM